MTKEEFTISEAFECVLSVVDRFDRRCAMAGESCAEFALDHCQALLTAERLAVLSNPRAYLFRSTERACARYYTRKRKIKIVSQPNGIADACAEPSRDSCQIVWDTIASLRDEFNPRERVCAESLASGFLKKDIANRLGICPSSVSGLAKQVLLKIKNRIAENDTDY